MRHELAPGTGDPGNFAIGDCTTQRNLDDTGRRRAAASGNRFRENGIKRADVYSSQWCRCRETAALIGLGEVRDLPALNSFYENYEVSVSQTNELKQWLGARSPGAPLILVSHQVNIRVLTGRSTRTGEIVVGRLGADGKISVLGSL
ncbi:MAG: histidine phosphatase family protein [Alphaproteobacteria bacterium BRH_c36]|nr:MAG: histidine phosphatase family protein [Alphaproteobacteria bacterium BRH_c36]